MQIFKKTAKEYGQDKKGKTLTKQGLLAEPGKKVHILCIDVCVYVCMYICIYIYI